MGFRPSKSEIMLLVGLLVVVGGRLCDGADPPPPPQFSAMFVFGDSLVDSGNNNFLNSLAKANYIPYGIDYYMGPTGRFCNGKTFIDFLGINPNPNLNRLLNVSSIFPLFGCS